MKKCKRRKSRRNQNFLLEVTHLILFQLHLLPRQLCCSVVLQLHLARHLLFLVNFQRLLQLLEALQLQLPHLEVLLSST